MFRVHFSAILSIFDVNVVENNELVKIVYKFNYFTQQFYHKWSSKDVDPNHQSDIISQYRIAVKTEGFFSFNY